MQTFNADIRKEMQRLDSPEYIIRRLEEISAIDNLAVVIDLLFGFPGQKWKSLDRRFKDRLRASD